MAKLCRIQVLVAQGEAAGVACREAGGQRASYIRPAQRVRGLRLDQDKRSRELRKDIQRLRKLVAEPSRVNPMLEEARRDTSGSRVAPSDDRHTPAAVHGVQAPAFPDSQASSGPSMKPSRQTCGRGDADPSDRGAGLGGQVDRDPISLARRGMSLAG